MNKQYHFSTDDGVVASAEQLCDADVMSLDRNELIKYMERVGVFDNFNHDLTLTQLRLMYFMFNTSFEGIVPVVDSEDLALIGYIVYDEQQDEILDLQVYGLIRDGRAFVATDKSEVAHFTSVYHGEDLSVPDSIDLTGIGDDYRFCEVDLIEGNEDKIAEKLLKVTN